MLVAPESSAAEVDVAAKSLVEALCLAFRFVSSESSVGSWSLADERVVVNRREARELVCLPVFLTGSWSLFEAMLVL